MSECVENNLWIFVDCWGCDAFAKQEILFR